jgi:hypothetical protein
MQEQNDPTTATLRGSDFYYYEPDVLEQLELDGWTPAQVTELALTELKISDGRFISNLEHLVYLDLSDSQVGAVFPLPNVTTLDLRRTVVTDGSRWEVPASVQELRLNSLEQLTSLDALPRLKVLYVTEDEFYPELYYLLVKKETALERFYIPSPDPYLIGEELLRGCDVRRAPSYTAMVSGRSASAEGTVGLYNSVILLCESGDQRIVSHNE